MARRGHEWALIRITTNDLVGRPLGEIETFVTLAEAQDRARSLTGYGTLAWKSVSSTEVLYESIDATSERYQIRWLAVPR